jgi:hypothetical protein
MADECVVKKNLGLVRCNKLPDMPKGMIVTPKAFELTPEEAINPTVWQAKLLLTPGVRIHLWPEFDGIEDVSTEAAYDQSVLSDLVADMGKYAWRAMISQNLCLHKAMFSHSGKGDRVFLWDKKNFLVGKLNAAGNFQGFKMSLLNTEKLKLGDGSVATKTPVYIVLRDHLELDQNGTMVDGSFVNDLLEIVDVTLEVVGTPIAATIVVDVMLSCDESPLVGLIAADFLVLTTAGATQAKTAAESATVPGRYTLTAGTTFVDGTVTLVPAATLSVEAYEAENILTIDIA